MKNNLVSDGKKIFNLLGKEKWKYLLSVITCAIVVPAFDLALPWVTKWMINAVEIGSKELLIQGFSTITIIFILYSIMVPITAYHFEGRSHKPLLGVRLDLLKHIIGMPFNFFSNQHSGELMSRLTGDIDELFDFYKEQTYDIISILVKGIGALVMLLMLDIRIAVPVIILGIISALSRSYRIEALKENSDVIQSFTNAIYKAQLWVSTHTSEEIAQSIHQFFPDMEIEDLVTVVERYQSIDAWATDPVLKEDSLNNLMDVMELAGQLDNRAPYETIVDTSYAENAINNIK